MGALFCVHKVQQHTNKSFRSLGFSRISPASLSSSSDPVPLAPLRSAYASGSFSFQPITELTLDQLGIKGQPQASRVGCRGDHTDDAGSNCNEASGVGYFDTAAAWDGSIRG